jgi:hypothetical protein
MEDLYDRVTELEAQISSLTARLAEPANHLAPEPVPRVGGAATTRGGGTTPDVEQAGSRRNLFKFAAGAAVGGTALAIAKSAGPVAAGDGDHIEVGATTDQGDTGRTTTVLSYSNAAGPQTANLAGPPLNANIMTVRDGFGVFAPFNLTASDYPAALGGYAYSKVPNGVYGKSANKGYGVVGSGSGDGATGVLARGTRANIELQRGGTPPATRIDAHTVGELVCDSAGDLWCCTAPGKPGSWKKLAGSHTTGAFAVLPTPKRVYDSRVGQIPLGVNKGKLNPGSTRVVDCTVGAPEVPNSARAVVMNITAANTTGLGNLAVYPDGSPAPATSSINFTGGVNIANSTTSGCGPSAKVKVLAGGNTGADFIIDIVGYYV